MAEDMMTFDKRVKRIVKTHYGGKYSLKRRVIEGRGPLRLPVFQLLLFVGLGYFALTGAKIYMHQEMGSTGFSTHLAEMAKGGESARVAAKLLQRDRFMTFVEERI